MDGFLVSLMSADFMISTFFALILGTLYIRRRNQLLRENAKKEVTLVLINLISQH